MPDLDGSIWEEMTNFGYLSDHMRPHSGHLYV